MIFNEHSNLAGQHAFLSASRPHWLNYTDERLDASYFTAMAARRGTRLHELAAECIRLGVRLPDTTATLNAYVNDALGYRMTPEQILYYSNNCFGTTDAIAFRDGKLRIHDLKTGLTHTTEKQLEVYSALFCLEYGIKPHEIEIELRIYQSDEVREYVADPDVIVHIMDKIISFDRRIDAMKMEALS